MTDSKKSKNIFVVGKEQLFAACGIGLNPAMAFIVMACGSQGNHITTSWSCKAISDRTGISRDRAKKAIEDLIEHGLVEKTKGGSSPQYRLQLTEDANSWIWLPKSIVDGVGSEIPPLERLRQTRKVNMLIVFMLSYYLQDLDNEHGLPVNMLTSHNSELMPLYSSNVVSIFWCKTWGYEANWQWFAKSIFQQIGMDFNDFTSCLAELKDMGLITHHGVTFDGEDEDAEIVATSYGYGWVCNLYAQLKKQSAKSLKWPEDGYYIIVPKHIKNPTLRSVARLHYLPNTTKTARYYAIQQKIQERVTALLEGALSFEKGSARQGKTG